MHLVFVDKTHDTVGVADKMSHSGTARPTTHGGVGGDGDDDGPRVTTKTQMCGGDRQH